MPEQLHYLFVDRVNVDRSPTAEAVCRRIAAENGLPVEAGSAGISEGASRPVTKPMADLADRIFVMEPDMEKEMIREYGQDPAKIVCLNVPDLYERDDPDLVKMLEQKLYGHLVQEGLL